MIGSIGFAPRPEQRSALVTNRRQTLLYNTFLEEIHGTSSRSVAHLNVARLGQSLECGRRGVEIVYYFKRTPTIVQVPTGLFFMGLRFLNGCSKGIRRGVRWLATCALYLA